MEYEHSAGMLQSFDLTQSELRRPFYLVRAEMHERGPDYFEAKYGGVSGFGKTPQVAAIAFDLKWLNGSIDKAAIARARGEACQAKNQNCNGSLPFAGVPGSASGRK